MRAVDAQSRAGAGPRAAGLRDDPDSAAGNVDANRTEASTGHGAPKASGVRLRGHFIMPQDEQEQKGNQGSEGGWLRRRRPGRRGHCGTFKKMKRQRA